MTTQTRPDSLTVGLAVPGMTTQTRPDSLTVHLSAATAGPVTASPAARTITGLAVPYGPVGNSSAGALTFGAGSLTWSATGRVKLLRQHDPDVVLGYATHLEDTPAGLLATFEVPESPEGDVALQEAADGRRDGLSVGVLLDEATLEQIVDKWVEGDTSPTAASGELLEVSQVSIPAFRDSRIDGSAAATLTGHVTLSVNFGEPTPSPEEHSMATVETPVSAPADAAVETPPSAPAPQAVAGAAVTGTEAPVYTFDGTGPSFARDVFYARFDLNRQAQDRLARFNQQMLAGAGAQLGMVTAAVEDRTDHAKWIQNGYRPDMLVAAIDRGRPLVSRIGTVNLTDATPFRIPVEGEFTNAAGTGSGVADHTEGTAHVTEGAFSTSDVTVNPTAVSGAYRLSRELIDAANPALDQIVLRAMARDYRKVTEAKVVAALLAADGTATLSIDTVVKLRTELNDFYDTNGEAASFVAASTSYYSTLLADVDTAGRPMLASINPENAAGSASPGWTGANVDGTQLVKSSGIATNDAFIVQSQDVLIGESPLRTFRFDEVEGPGIIKLALWSYFVAKVTRASGVEQITSAAA